MNSGAYRQLSNNLRSGFISEFRYEDLDLVGSFDGEGGYGMNNIRGSESDLVGIGAVHSQWALTRYNNVLSHHPYYHVLSFSPHYHDSFSLPYFHDWSFSPYYHVLFFPPYYHDLSFSPYYHDLSFISSLSCIVLFSLFSCFAHIYDSFLFSFLCIWLNCKLFHISWFWSSKHIW